MDKPHALIVEDDRDIAALFRHVLDIAGYRTEIVMDGRDAIERLHTTRPDIILLDLTLPGVPGAKILEYVRREERLRGVPVVVVTAHSHIAETLPVEPDLVLLKPVNLSQLSSLVQRLRTTPASMRDAPWDPVTHLYNREFFTVRLSYSLDRSRQIDANQFGILLVDVVPYDELRKYPDQNQVDLFMREIAGHLKMSLRPTDTVSRFEDGLFLVLLEDIPDYSTPSRIAMRVDRDLLSFVAHKRLVPGLRSNVGLMICNANYQNVEEVLADIRIARRQSGDAGARLQYDRETLNKLRTGSGA